MARAMEREKLPVGRLKKMCSRVETRECGFTFTFKSKFKSTLARNPALEGHGIS